MTVIWADHRCAICLVTNSVGRRLTRVGRTFRSAARTSFSAAASSTSNKRTRAARNSPLSKAEWLRWNLTGNPTQIGSLY